MRICNHCGSQEEDYALFCTKCGMKLEPEAVSEVSPAADISEAQAVMQEPAAAAEPASAASGASPFACVEPPVARPGAYTSSSYVPQGEPFRSAQGGGRDWAGIAALICGIVSMPCCLTCGGGFILGALAIVFGIMGLKSANRSLAIAGIICGGVGVLCSIVFTVFAFFTTASSDFQYGGHDFNEFFDNITDSIPV